MQTGWGTPREKWTFPAKPNLPHTMSIDFGSSCAGEAADSSVVLAGPDTLAVLPPLPQQSMHNGSEYTCLCGGIGVGELS